MINCSNLRLISFEHNIYMQAPQFASFLGGWPLVTTGQWPPVMNFEDDMQAASAHWTNPTQPSPKGAITKPITFNLTQEEIYLEKIHYRATIDIWKITKYLWGPIANQIKYPGRKVWVCEGFWGICARMKFSCVQYVLNMCSNVLNMCSICARVKFSICEEALTLYFGICVLSPRPLLIFNQITCQQI